MGTCQNMMYKNEEVANLIWRHFTISQYFPNMLEKLVIAFPHKDPAHIC